MDFGRKRSAGQRFWGLTGECSRPAALGVGGSTPSTQTL
ncbi:hypothetical protein ACCUM_0879 [Candidatus Accumulibacter phosphatis]|uniref:Uncharacterized protein n=1 Tax=Candidatus Accumulibacter phosphatis TaxID=327160 RepID=A0A5S4ETE1_9PROT|nr:hypothetical protein ACCUM_0879 [Candidatus Accumulibacter phosphatis]